MKLKADAEIIAAYAKSRTPVESKMGAHGLSMGGMIATHLARRGLIDFLFVDRTFYDLQEVPVYSMGVWSKYALKILTLWSGVDSTEDYIFTNCYKVIAQDPNDEVIHDNASMKTGVSLKIVSDLLFIPADPKRDKEESPRQDLRDTFDELRAYGTYRSLG